MRKVLVGLVFLALLCAAYFAGSWRGREAGDTPPPPGRAASDRFKPGDTAIVVADRVELRDGEKILARLGKECRLSVEKLSGSWAGGTVQISGKQLFGWVHESHLGLPARAASRDEVAAAVPVEGAAKPGPIGLPPSESPTEPSAVPPTKSPVTLAERVAVQQAALETLPSAPPIGMRVVVAREPADLEELATLQSIERLVITGEAFNNESLRLLEGLQIPSLSIECPNIGNGGLVPISQIKNLRELRIWTLGVTDAGLEIVAQNAALESLDLEGTGVQGAGLTRLQGLARLTHLTLGPKTTDADLASLKGLTHLADLDLRACYQLSDASFDSLRSLSALRSIWLPSRLMALGTERLQQALPGCTVRQ